MRGIPGDQSGHALIKAECQGGGEGREKFRPRVRKRVAGQRPKGKAMSAGTSVTLARCHT